MSRCVESREITNKIGGNRNISRFLERIYEIVERIYAGAERIYAQQERIYAPQPAYIRSTHCQKFMESKKRIYAQYERIYAPHERIYAHPERIYAGFLCLVLPRAYKYTLALLSPIHTHNSRHFTTSYSLSLSKTL